MRLQTVGEAPGQHIPTEPIYAGHQGAKSTCQAEIRAIGGPDEIGLRDGNIAQERGIEMKTSALCTFSNELLTASPSPWALNCAISTVNWPSRSRRLEEHTSELQSHSFIS